MDNGFEILMLIKSIVFWLSPVLLIFGFILVLYGNYKRLEDFFGKEFLHVKLLPKIESNIYNFHEWLLEKKTLLGVICLILGIVVFFLFR